MAGICWCGREEHKACREEVPKCLECHPSWGQIHTPKPSIHHSRWTGGRWVGEEGVWLCLGAWRHIYRTCYCGQFHTRSGPHCSLLVNLRIGISGWATGDSNPSSRLILRCPRLGLQSEVSDFLWMVVSDHIDLFPFVLSPYGMTWISFDSTCKFSSFGTWCFCCVLGSA